MIKRFLIVFSIATSICHANCPDLLIYCPYKSDGTPTKQKRLMVHTLVNQKITGGQCRPMTKEATWTQINADQICPKDQTVVKAIESDEAKDFIQRSQLPHLHCKSNPPTGERCPQQDLEERHEKTGKWVKYQP